MGTESLAFDFLHTTERVRITKKMDEELKTFRISCVVAGCLLGAPVLALSCGVWELMSSDFDLDDVSVLGEQSALLFFPTKDCVGESALTAYAVLLLLVWLPAAIIGAVVWPTWLLSLKLAVALVTHGVQDLMATLDPENTVRQADRCICHLFRPFRRSLLTDF